VLSDVTLEPVNIAAIVGQNVTFTCATSEPGKVRWDYFKARWLQSYVIWNGLTVRQPTGDPPDTPLFHVNEYQCKNETRCDLTINKVAMRDAGWIDCREASSLRVFGASLTVLGESYSNYFYHIVMRNIQQQLLSRKTLRSHCLLHVL